MFTVSVPCPGWMPEKSAVDWFCMKLRRSGPASLVTSSIPFQVQDRCSGSGPQPVSIDSYLMRPQCDRSTMAAVFSIASKASSSLPKVTAIPF